jgi:hypothetical protein
MTINVVFMCRNTYQLWYLSWRPVDGFMGLQLVPLVLNFQMWSDQ